MGARLVVPPKSWQAMRRLSLLLPDANVVIHLFEIGIWAKVVEQDKCTELTNYHRRDILDPDGPLV
jgi:hypothetical protein